MRRALPLYPPFLGTDLKSVPTGGQGEDTVSPAERGEEQKHVPECFYQGCADNEVWRANRRFVK